MGVPWIITFSCLCPVAWISSANDGIMTHDSATGYLNASDGFVTKMAKTQVGSFYEQLDCGARAFDLRPRCHLHGKDTPRVTMHHAEVDIEYPLQAALKDIIDWSKANPSEFVMVGLSHHTPNNTRCREAVSGITKDLGLMPSIGSSSGQPCGALERMTMREAKQAAALDGGGYVFMIEASDDTCVAENYVPDIRCYNSTSPHEGSCYTKDSPQWYNYANNQLFDYIQKMAASTTERNSSQLQMNQAHWQYDFEVYEGVDARHSSLIMDEYFSQVNRRLTDIIDGFPYLNLLEVDNVCNYGPSLLKSVRSRQEKLSSGRRQSQHQQGLLYRALRRIKRCRSVEGGRLDIGGRFLKATYGILLTCLSATGDALDAALEHLGILMVELVKAIAWPFKWIFPTPEIIQTFKGRPLAMVLPIIFVCNIIMLLYIVYVFCVMPLLGVSLSSFSSIGFHLCSLLAMVSYYKAVVTDPGKIPEDLWSSPSPAGPPPPHLYERKGKDGSI
ncbi:hypothetical protein FOZ63_030660, partial [Perkinsus olseni]